MLSEHDWQLLQAYLDDDLSADEVQRLDGRLSLEVELSEALQSLRVQRNRRLAVFRSALPTAKEADDLANRVIRSSQRVSRHRLRLAASRVAAVCALCLLTGFFAGRARNHSFGGRLGASSADPPAKSGTVLIQNSLAPYEVQVADENGNVIAVQRFKHIEEAQQFYHDLGEYESRRQQLRDGQAMLIADQF